MVWGEAWRGRHADARRRLDHSAVEAEASAENTQKEKVVENVEKTLKFEQSEDGFSEGEVLFAIVLEARKHPDTFTTERVHELLLSVGYGETWEDAGQYLDFEKFERRVSRR